MWAVLLIQDNIVQDVIHTGTAENIAQIHFLSALRNRLTSWDDYSPEDIETILDQGYEQIGNGSICLVNLNND